MTIPASANLGAITNGAVPDASKVNGELAWIESRAADAGALAGETFQGPINYAADTGAANAYVITLAPALTSLVTGQEVTFKAVNANTGASTLNVNGLGVRNILKFGNVALVAGDVIAGAVVVVRYDGTAWQLVSQARTTTGERQNLNLANNATLPNSQVDVSWDVLTIEDVRVAGFSGTVNIAVSGANGLDTGAEASSTWYAVWAIHNPAGPTTALLLSASFTAPTMPSGYTKKRRVGSVRNLSTGNFQGFTQRGDTVLFHEYASILTTASTSFVALDFSSYMPPISRRLVADVDLSLTGSVAGTLYIARTRPTGVSTSGFERRVARGTLFNSSMTLSALNSVVIETSASQQADFRLSDTVISGGIDIAPMGYIDHAL